MPYPVWWKDRHKMLAEAQGGPMYLDPPPMQDTTKATVAERQQFTLELLADAERALTRLRMEGMMLPRSISGSVGPLLDAVTACLGTTPETRVGLGLHSLYESNSN